MKVKIYDINGMEKGDVTLADAVFNIEPNRSAIYYALRAERANMRQGTAATKGRSEVSGGGSKLYRQKGTGRARAGSRRSPVRVGGGIAFGPKPRSYRIDLPKKIKRLSIRSLLSLKNSENTLKVIEDFSVDSGKTGDFCRIAENLVDKKRRMKVLIVDSDRNPMNRRAGRNIPWISYFDAQLLKSCDLYYARQVILTESAVKVLNERYSDKL